MCKAVLKLLCCWQSTLESQISEVLDHHSAVHHPIWASDAAASPGTVLVSAVDTLSDRQLAEQNFVTGSCSRCRGLKAVGALATLLDGTKLAILTQASDKQHAKD